jgi:hypothetical protein
MSRLIKKQEVNDTDFGHVIGRFFSHMREKKKGTQGNSPCGAGCVCVLGSDPTIPTANRSVSCPTRSLAFPCVTQKVCARKDSVF